jgi:hypothetical protein
MEDSFQIFIYIALAAVYFFFSLSGSKDKKTPPKKVSEPAQKSLQDILREIQGNFTPAPTTTSTSTSSAFNTKPKQPSAKSLQELLDEIKAEQRAANLEERAEDFEEDVFDSRFRSDFESGKNVDWDNRIKIDHPKKPELDSDNRHLSPKKNPSAFRKILRNKASLKQAFILSEIFNKKF